jgi:hypothetical protein
MRTSERSLLTDMRFVQCRLVNAYPWISVWRRRHASYESQKLPSRETLSDLPTSDPYDAKQLRTYIKHNVQNIFVRCGLVNAFPWVLLWLFSVAFVHVATHQLIVVSDLASRCTNSEPWFIIGIQHDFINPWCLISMIQQNSIYSVIKDQLISHLKCSFRCIISLFQKVHTSLSS